MRNTLFRGIVLATLVMAIPLGAAPASAAHLACKELATFGLGRGPDLGTAMNNAIQNWRMRTSQAYGAAYGYYNNALNYGRHCNRKDSLTYCRVWADPCR
jgi:hypothetical protein